MTSVMEQGGNEDEFNLREWAVKARIINRENTSSRRFSASNIRSFREGSTRSFRSNVTISSTASSPGYTFTEEIDPSTYSFTAALKALQLARPACSWEYCSPSSPDGFALNSKWNEAEKYICNPESGEFPMECLSAKTLSGRSFRSLAAGKITMSAPLIYPAPNSQTRLVHSKSSFTEHKNEVHSPIQEKKLGRKTRDVGTQSTPPELSSSSPSPAPTPSIREGSIKRDNQEEAEDSPGCNMAKLKFEEKAKVKETREKEETKRKEGEDKGKKATHTMCWRCRQGGCLPWKCLWMRKRQREKHKSRKKNFFIHRMINGCQTN